MRSTAPTRSAERMSGISFSSEARTWFTTASAGLEPSSLSAGGSKTTAETQNWLQSDIHTSLLLIPLDSLIALQQVPELSAMQIDKQHLPAGVLCFEWSLVHCRLVMAV